MRGTADDALSAQLGARRFGLMVPLGPGGHMRLIWMHGGADPSAEEALAAARTEFDLDFERVGRFSSYRVRHRVAARFRQGPVFLAGDAAHVHSPHGGQGMNTGVQDAHHRANLLADVAAGHLGAHVAPRILRTGGGRRLAGWVGQYRIRYHLGGPGRAAPAWADDPLTGRRIPPSAANSPHLRRLAWQLRCYGSTAGRPPGVPDWIEGPVYLPADPHGDLRSDRLYPVRPDSFIAAALPLHAGAVSVHDLRDALDTAGIAVPLP